MLVTFEDGASFVSVDLFPNNSDAMDQQKCSIDSDHGLR